MWVSPTPFSLVICADNDPFGLHRPGWRIPSGGSESDVAFRDSQRKLVEEAHAEYLDRLTNAWKGNRSTNA